MAIQMKEIRLPAEAAQKEKLLEWSVANWSDLNFDLKFEFWNDDMDSLVLSWLENFIFRLRVGYDQPTIFLFH